MKNQFYSFEGKGVAIIKAFVDCRFNGRDYIAGEPLFVLEDIDFALGFTQVQKTAKVAQISKVHATAFSCEYVVFNNLPIQDNILKLILGENSQKEFYIEDVLSHGDSNRELYGDFAANSYKNLRIYEVQTGRKLEEPEYVVREQSITFAKNGKYRVLLDRLAQNAVGYVLDSKQNPILVDISIKGKGNIDGQGGNMFVRINKAAIQETPTLFSGETSYTNPVQFLVLGEDNAEIVFYG